MWGLGNLNGVGYRTLIAQFADDLAAAPAKSLDEVANRWGEFFRNAYAVEFAPQLKRTQDLIAKTPKTDDEERELFFYLSSLSGGFCLGGNLPQDRRPRAFEFLYDPSQLGSKPVEELPTGSTKFWGCPNIMHRLLYGVDFQILQAVMDSGKWAGTQDDLTALILPHCLGQPLHLPIREAIDWLHASIYTTIKTMKFSHLPQCAAGR